MCNARSIIDYGIPTLHQNIELLMFIYMKILCSMIKCISRLSKLIFHYLFDNL
jgi:hypothetical protein